MTGVPHFIVLHFITLRSVYTAFFLQIDDLRQPCFKQVCWHRFSTAFVQFLSLCHIFVNSHDVSSFFIIIVLVLRICS